MWRKVSDAEQLLPQVQFKDCLKKLVCMFFFPVVSDDLLMGGSHMPATHSTGAIDADYMMRAKSSGPYKIK